MKRTDPWKLAVIFLSLVLVFIAVRKFRSPRLEGNLPVSLAEIDTAAVTELIITPAKARRQPVRIAKAGGWKLMNGEQALRLEQGAGPNLLRVLTNLKPERMASKRSDKWDQFNVGDSSGTRVQVMEGASVQADLVIGRSGFGQTASQSYGGPAFTYIRLKDESEVYAIGGFLDGQFNRPLDDWRDKSFMRLKKDSVTRVRFRYPADSSFVLEKVSGKWTSGGATVDSLEVRAYLSGMEYRNATAFAAVAPEGPPSVTVTLEQGERMLGTLEAWPADGAWVVRSSHQPETFFSFDAAGRKEIFSYRKRFTGRK
jgi:hypothetical protein